MADPQPTRQYLFSEEQIRAIFVASGIGAVTVLVGLLLLASARPQGRFEALDESQYQETLERAAASLEGFEDLGEGRARLDIDRAMELIAERGVASAVVVGSAGAATDAAAAGGEGQAALPDGAAVYASCTGCHQATGQGIPAAFPPLAGHAVDLYEADRSYLPVVLLYGLQGEIVVDGATYNGVMPAWSQLSDEEIAAVLNFTLSEWGNDDALPDDFLPYGAEDVAAERGRDLAAPDVYEIRQGLDLP